MARMSSFSVSYIDTIACTRLVLPVLASLLLAGCSFTAIGPDYKNRIPRCYVKQHQAV